MVKEEENDGLGTRAHFISIRAKMGQQAVY